jgi:hypothetical protein
VTTCHIDSQDLSLILKRRFKNCMDKNDKNSFRFVINTAPSSTQCLKGLAFP